MININHYATNRIFTHKIKSGFYTAHILYTVYFPSQKITSINQYLPIPSIQQLDQI